MSKKSDIINGTLAHASRSGLIYTCKGGWIDLGHARPDNARDNLWTPLLNETGSKSKNRKGFKLRFAETQSKFGLTTGVAREYYIGFGLKKGEKESIALAVFMEVSMGFEALQSNFLYRRVTDSGFSAEDLFSNIVGFYKAVRPGTDYIALLQPVSKEAGVQVWDTYGVVGNNKNQYFAPFIYPCSECSNSPMGPMSGRVPDILNAIEPAKKGPDFRDWNYFTD